MATGRTLNGSGHFRFAASILSRDVGTFAVWMKKNSNSNPQTFFDSDGTRHAFYFVSLTRLSMYIDGREQYFNSTIPTDGSWNHVALAWNKTGNVQKLYVNGSDITPNSPGGTWGSTALGTYAWIGSRYAENEVFDGAMACPAIYNAVLSAGEITSLAGGLYPTSVAAGNLIEMWDFSGASPEVGTNANNLTILGTSSTTTGPTLTSGGSTFVPQVIMVL